ncbi:hypothetical protein [Hydrogenophaga sp. RWCD_12]|uniref:hypothetical protein n=1 Tax=Hydrogenophaga sp. RWCD_12 TaxID=3391190 RepID=UPI0039856412
MNPALPSLPSTPRCVACKAQVFYTAIRVCHACGYVHCVRCDGIGGNVSDTCVRCGSPDVTSSGDDAEAVAQKLN